MSQDFDVLHNKVMSVDFFFACSDPTNEDGPEVASLFGECIFSTYTEADLELTMEIQAAAETASYPARSVQASAPSCFNY